MAESATRKKYASDITDEQWAIIEPIVTGSHREERRGRERTVSLREIVNASGNCCRMTWLPRAQHTTISRSGVNRN